MGRYRYGPFQPWTSVLALDAGWPEIRLRLSQRGERIDRFQSRGSEVGRQPVRLKGQVDCGP